MPVKGGGGIGGPRKKPKSKRSVGAAIGGAGRKPAPKTPRPRPGARTVGATVQRTGRPVTNRSGSGYTLPSGRRGDAPQTRKQDTRKASKYNRSPQGRASRAAVREQQRKVALAKSLIGTAEAARRSKVQRVNPGTVEAIGTAVGRTVLGSAPTGSSTNVRGARGGRDLSRKKAPAARREAIRALDRELKGEGDTAKAVAKAAKALGRTGALFGNSRGKGKQGGTGNLAAVIGPAAAAISAGSASTPLVRRGLEDVVNAPATAIPSVYVPAKAAVSAARGDTKPAKEYWKGIQENDPVYAAATLDFGRAKKLASEHPGFTGLEVFGVAKGASRGAGAGLRGGGRTVAAAGRAARSKKVEAAGKRIRQVGAVEGRPSARVAGTGLEVKRLYSKGVVGKAVGVQRDKRGTKRAAELRKEADLVEQTDPARARALRTKAAKADPTVASPKQIRRRADLHEAAGESRRQRYVQDAEQKVSDITQGEKGAALNLITQGITRATPDDLRAYRSELERAFSKIKDPDKQAANKQIRDLIDESLKAEEKKPGTLKASAEKARRYSSEVDQPLDKLLTDLGLIDADQAARVKLESYAARSMGGRVTTKKTSEDVATSRQRVKSARKRAARANREAREAQRELDAMQGRAEVLSRNVGGRAAEVAAQRAGNPRARAAGEYAGGGRGVRAAAERVNRATAQREAARRNLARVEAEHQRIVDLSRQTAFLTERGNPLPDAAIRAHMRRNGIDPDAVGYVSQAPNATSAGAYFRSAAKEPTTEQRARTEKATTQGTFDASTEPLRARAMKAANLVAGAENYRNGVRVAGVRGKDGNVEIASRAGADELAKNMTQQTGTEYTVIRARPWGVKRDQFEKMVEDINDLQDARSYEPFRNQIIEGLQGKGDGPFAVVPKEWAQRLEQHTNVLGPSDAGKALQAGRAAFSQTVLSVSPSPTIGNAVEGYGVRIPLRRAGPLSAYTYHQVMKRLRADDPKVAAEVEDMLLGSGRVTLQTRGRHFQPDQLSEGTMRNIASGIEAVRRAPVGKQASTAWQLWKSLVFDVVNNRLIERPVQKALAGKAIRDRGLMDGSLFNASAKAFDQAAQGLKNTAAQVDLANNLVDTYGQYRAFSPGQRQLIANYTPFLAWWKSSANFVLRVLPRDHPLVVALVAQAAQVTDDVDREKARPGWLKGTLEAGGTRWQATRNTPLGAFTSPLESGAGLLLPQVQTVLAAAKGQDWKGRPLRRKDGTPYDEIDKTAYILKELGASMTPIVAVPDRAMSYGKDPSTLLNAFRVKPNGQTVSDTPRVKGTQPKQTKARRDPQLEALRREARQSQASGGYSQREVDALRREAEALARQGVK